MNVDVQVLVSVLSGAAIAVILFHKAVWKGVKLLGRTALGGVLLAVLSSVSGYTGLHLGVNLLNALVIGILGLPGFGLLAALQWITG